jgi:uncharacterized protein (TIGR03435 family)
MRRLIISAGCLLQAYSSALGEESGPKFEVATVKPSTRFSSGGYSFRGGPGTADPERFTFQVGSLKLLLLRALDLKYYQFSGPDWLDSEGFEIVAKVPAGATKDQLTAMLKNLVVERFHLTFHHEAREMSVFELTVGKDGAKLKESDLNIQSSVRQPGSPVVPLSIDKTGFPEPRPGPSFQLIGRVTNGIMRVAGNQLPLSELVKWMESGVERPVVDKTGLAGKYDLRLAYSSDGLKQLPAGRVGAEAIPVDDTPSGGPSLMKALQDQLGLELKSAKDPIDIVVIDHIDKAPTEN